MKTALQAIGISEEGIQACIDHQYATMYRVGPMLVGSTRAGGLRGRTTGIVMLDERGIIGEEATRGLGERVKRSKIVKKS